MYFTYSQMIFKYPPPHMWISCGVTKFTINHGMADTAQKGFFWVEEFRCGALLLGEGQER